MLSIFGIVMFSLTILPLYGIITLRSSKRVCLMMRLGQALTSQRYLNIYLHPNRNSTLMFLSSIKALI